MKNSFGNNIILTIFGESHGNSVGFVLDGIPAGISVNEENIKSLLDLRRPSGSISTARAENDEFTVHSGVFNGYTCGTPICVTIRNADARSKDYTEKERLARPSHADYTAHVKYRGYEDYRGGGHFSGRITSAIVAAGGILIPALNKKGIYIGTHLKSVAGVSDREFLDIEKDIKNLADARFAVLDISKKDEMEAKINEARANGDSVGGVLETAIVGLEAGVGEPWFDTLEGMISHAVFSVPAVKGIEFGAGFVLCDMLGSQANDAITVTNGRTETKTNNSGGINGGISNGMPIIFRTAIKPTPTIAKEQETINYVNNENAVISASGRHDPCIAHRARIVLDCISALVVADALATRQGTDWLAL